MVRRLLAGERKAEHFSLKKGGTVEFAEHRAYTPGDDLRYLDWNVYARHGELFVKEFAAEEDLHVLLLLDLSRSMNYGNPNRFRFALRLCASLAYIALAQFDTCSIYTLGNKPVPLVRKLRGKNRIFDVLERLDGLECEAVKPLDSISDFPFGGSRKNTAGILISDFYDREALQTFLRKLGSIYIELFGLHVLTPQELHPETTGTTKLVDVETGEEMTIDIDGESLQQYQNALEKHLENTKSLCLQYGEGYARLLSDMPLVSTVVRLLQKNKILT